MHTPLKLAPHSSAPLGGATAVAGLIWGSMPPPSGRPRHVHQLSLQSQLLGPDRTGAEANRRRRMQQQQRATEEMRCRSHRACRRPGPRPTTPFTPSCYTTLRYCSSVVFFVARYTGCVQDSRVAGGRIFSFLSLHLCSTFSPFARA